VLRELMRGRLPSSVLARRKEGFDIPAHQWLRTCLRPLVEDTINRQTVQATGLFEWPVLNRFLTAHMDRRANYGYHIWGLLTLFLWIDRWKVQPAAAPENLLSVTTS
jgi:asparagine synthase (glutamine-hydrolysing)